MRSLEMPGEGCSSPAMCCPAAKGRCKRVALGWRIKAATPASLGFFNFFITTKRENNMWREPACPWANHRDEGRSTHGPARSSSQDGGHQMESRLTQTCSSLGQGDDGTPRCFPSPASSFLQDTHCLWGLPEPAGSGCPSRGGPEEERPFCSIFFQE